jgi:hypothetical protein
MEWTECFLCNAITDAHTDAIIAEQRAFYGF